MLDESEITDAVRARFLALESVPYPKMILRSMPKTFADPDVTPKIQELARLSVRNCRQGISAASCMHEGSR